MSKENGRPYHNCVHCNYTCINTIKNAGAMKVIYSDHTVEKTCDVYELICAKDKQKKGICFSPYEWIYPEFCPLDTKTNLIRKIFDYFSNFIHNLSFGGEKK